jgi:hypothetical protein
MPLSWNEIKTRSLSFAKEWENESSENAEAKSFWDGFFHIFGITRKRIASFEEPVKKLGEKQGFIDLFWKGVLIVEHKSRGKNLDRAYTQALDYFPGIPERNLPKYVLVSDFVRFRLYDLEEKEQHDFLLKDLHKNVRLFGFIAGYQTHKIQEQDPVNMRAAERMGRLHDQLKDIGYTGHVLEHYLVRLLFCLFADDTGIFQRQQFQEYLEQRTHEDGSDLGSCLNTLFHVLNTPEDQRYKNLDEQLAAFPYINGRLFAETLPPASFDTAMRQSLLDCCAPDWSRISPAIFGSLFQSIMDKTARRNLGAHYTSEKNILKLIRPLFLDVLWETFEKIKTNEKKLFQFHQSLRDLTFLDPACGCGNFLVIAYRELRLLELAILRILTPQGQTVIEVPKFIILNIDQFYGIEIEEFPAQIAQVALWLMDHQMNLMVSEEFGRYFARIPLKTSANIICGNALRIDWKEIVPADRLSYILGNPPFVGKSLQSDEQKADMRLVFNGRGNPASLDFVSAWYVKAADMMSGNPALTAAFVSTNSIAQGEQVAGLWPVLLEKHIHINFAHRTFQWNNEASGMAAVHCVIIGFSMIDAAPKYLFEYENIKGEPQVIQAKNINPFLVDAPSVVLKSRRDPICPVSPMLYGSKPADGGNLLLSDAEYKELIHNEPASARWVKRFLNADEFINNTDRYCLWLADCPPNILNSMPHVKKRVEKVRDMRRASTKAATREQAATPTLFAEIRQCKTSYLLVPAHTSENRTYIPVGYLSADVICGNANFQIPDATLYDFGIFTSLMHNAWMRTVCGRIKSDYRYSNTIVYNNFPWPENPGDKQKQDIEAAAQAVLDARAQFPDASLADLYDPLTMPPVLLKAHQKLDKAVDAAYGKKTFPTEAARVAFLFELYQNYICRSGPCPR